MKSTTRSLDEKARGLAADFLRTEGQLLLVLMEMRRNNVFPALTYSGIYEYCLGRLKLSPAQSYYFKSVAEKSSTVPALGEAVAQGKLTLSQARRIVPVVTAENQVEWIAKAGTLPQA